MYSEGQGVTQDEQQAAQWCRKAAEQETPETNIPI